MNKKWRDLTPGQRGAILVAGSIEVTLTAMAARDLWSRPAEQIRGRKGLWWLGIFVQPLGPVAYLLAGRR